MSTPNETSLKDKVRAISKAQGRPFNVIWRSLVLERFLARVAASTYRDRFIFKGGMLLSQYVKLGRETADLDFLIQGLKADIDKITAVIEEICLEETSDGFKFIVAKVAVVDHLLTKYPGYELTLDASCGKTKTKVSVDLGVGGWAEAISKEIELTGTAKGPIFEPEISLMVYPVEMIFAEKLQTACFRGSDNSRMKDYHDLFVLCETKEKIDAIKAENFIINVFSDRETPLSLIPTFEGEDLNNLESMWARHHAALMPKVKEKLPTSIASVITKVNTWLSTNISILKN